MQAQFLAGRPRFDCNRTLAAARNDADPEALLPRAEAELADEAALAFGLFERLEDSAQLIAHALCPHRRPHAPGSGAVRLRRAALRRPRGPHAPRRGRRRDLPPGRRRRVRPAVFLMWWCHCRPSYWGPAQDADAIAK
mmetsp:Transcript_2221/g.7292  ORF Transcript_2221/g.7292 Transcript_2221/m.7292 type:complete len:138 (+) Transcript_2221:162-575(+)